MKRRFFLIFLALSALFHFMLLSSLQSLPRGKPRSSKILTVINTRIVSGDLFKKVSGSGDKVGFVERGLRTVSSLSSTEKEGRGRGLLSFEEIIGAFGVEEVSPVYLYLEEVKELIRSRWNLPPGLKDRVVGLKCKILLRVRRDGHVLRKEFTLRSGNDVYDNSAMRAIDKSEPLPPFPLGIPDEEMELEVEF